MAVSYTHLDVYKRQELLNQYLTVAHFDNATAQAIMNEALKYQGLSLIHI